MNERVKIEPDGLPPKADGWPTRAEIKRAFEEGQASAEKELNAHRRRVNSLAPLRRRIRIRDI